MAVLSAITAFGYQPEIKDIDIRVSLDTAGTAHITEVWDVVVASGTEWYLVRENLGDISILNLQVTDETNAQYLNEGRWDVDRSLERKAFKCGLHKTSEGYEICWGVGSYGPHVFTVSYDMTNAVKSLNDYDMLHMQFVSDQLSALPGHVRLTLEAPVPLNAENSRIWGFGYEGTTAWSEAGEVVAESTEHFYSNSSLILLLRFDKGIFSSASVQDRSFDEVLEKALEGSHFGDEKEDSFAETFLGFIMFLVFCWVFVVLPIKSFLQVIGVVKYKDRKRIQKIFGVKKLPKYFEWSRTLPFNGDIGNTYYVASHVNGADDGKFSIIPAIMLHLMYEGIIVMRKGSNGKKEFHFDDSASTQNLSKTELEFLDILKKASGDDNILQEREFKRWTESHPSPVNDWVKTMREEVRVNLRDSGYLLPGKDRAFELFEFSPEGQKEAMQALNFRQYLKDFTIINERYAPEVALWGKYLIVASLFGIADKVAKDMNKLAPTASVGVPEMHVADISDVVMFTNVFRSATRFAYTLANAPSGGSGGSSGGWGGHSSFGGGGGFSGGGHGGGSR